MPFAGHSVFPRGSTAARCARPAAWRAWHRGRAPSAGKGLWTTWKTRLGCLPYYPSFGGSSPPCGRGPPPFRFRRRADARCCPLVGSVGSAACAARSAMNARISSTRHTVSPGLSLRGFGALPSRTQVHHVVALTGIRPGAPRRGSPNICDCLKKPVSKSVLTLMICMISPFRSARMIRNG